MQLHFQLNKSAHFVFDHLSDMQKFCSVHPIISKIEPKGENNYLVYETVKFGFIPYAFTYPVAIKSDPETMVVTIKANVSGGTKIEMEFMVKPQNQSSCLVTEIIQFKSWFPVKWVLKRLFREQHTRLFKNIEQIN